MATYTGTRKPSIHVEATAQPTTMSATDSRPLSVRIRLLGVGAGVVLALTAGVAVRSTTHGGQRTSHASAPVSAGRTAPSISQADAMGGYAESVRDQRATAVRSATLQPVPRGGIAETLETQAAAPLTTALVASRSMGGYAEWLAFSATTQQVSCAREPSTTACQ